MGKISIVLGVLNIVIFALAIVGIEVISGDYIAIFALISLMVGIPFSMKEKDKRIKKIGIIIHIITFALFIVILAILFVWMSGFY